MDCEVGIVVLGRVVNESRLAGSAVGGVANVVVDGRAILLLAAVFAAVS